MTFLDALSSPYFWSYTSAAALVLGSAGGALVRFQRRGADLHQVWRILWAWAALAAAVVVGILLGRELLVFLVVLASLLACREFARATGLYADWLFTALVYFAIVGANAVALWGSYDLFAATPIYAVALLCVLPLVRNQSEGMLERVALSVMAFVYFGYFLAHLSALAGVTPWGDTLGYLFFLLFGSGVVGLAADLADRKLGRRPIAPGISSEKTWEGAGVAVGLAFLWCFTLGWTLPSFDGLALFLAALILGIMGVLGDLVMRYILRDLRVGTTAAASPVDPVLALGHLNRLLFVAPLFFRLVHLFPPAGL